MFSYRRCAKLLGTGFGDAQKWMEHQLPCRKMYLHINRCESSVGD